MSILFFLLFLLFKLTMDSSYRQLQINYITTFELKEIKSYNE